MWFERLTGFREGRYEDVAGRFVVDGEQLTSRPNGRTMRWGRFETPSWPSCGRARRLARAGAGRCAPGRSWPTCSDSTADPANAGALFQVASQFNTLEMVGPSVTPEDGIDRYEGDHTQGPACAIACGAGTIYRNYLVPLEGRIGQSRDRQIDCLADLAAELGVDVEMRNGYAWRPRRSSTASPARWAAWTSPLAAP